jgi:hypothetical protein
VPVNFFKVKHQNKKEYNERRIVFMKWFSCFVGVNYNIGDEVTCDDNFYGNWVVCKIDKIYYRIRGGSRIKFFRLVFEIRGQVKTINTHHKKCKKVNLIG